MGEDIWVWIIPILMFGMPLFFKLNFKYKVQMEQNKQSVKDYEDKFKYREYLEGKNNFYDIYLSKQYVVKDIKKSDDSYAHWCWNCKTALDENDFYCRDCYSYECPRCHSHKYKDCFYKQYSSSYEWILNKYITTGKYKIFNDQRKVKAILHESSLKRLITTIYPEFNDDLDKAIKLQKEEKEKNYRNGIASHRKLITERMSNYSGYLDFLLRNSDLLINFEEIKAEFDNEGLLSDDEWLKRNGDISTLDDKLLKLISNYNNHLTIAIIRSAFLEYDNHLKFDMGNKLKGVYSKTLKAALLLEQFGVRINHSIEILILENSKNALLYIKRMHYIFHAFNQINIDYSSLLSFNAKMEQSDYKFMSDYFSEKADFRFFRDLDERDSFKKILTQEEIESHKKILNHEDYNVFVIKFLLVELDYLISKYNENATSKVDLHKLNLEKLGIKGEFSLDQIDLEIPSFTDEIQFIKSLENRNFRKCKIIAEYPNFTTVLLPAGYKTSISLTDVNKCVRKNECLYIPIGVNLT